MDPCIISNLTSFIIHTTENNNSPKQPIVYSLYPVYFSHPITGKSDGLEGFVIRRF